jgi:hypothetical protein
VTDPGSGGTITVDRWGSVVPVVTAGAEARTLAQPTKAGLITTVVVDTYVGDLTLTVTGGYNADAATSITFGTAGDYVTFVSIKVGASYYWRVVSQEGTNVAGEDMTVDQLTATTANVTTLTGTTTNATNATITTANVTTLTGTTTNATNSTITTANVTSLTGTTTNATTANLTNATLGRVQITSTAVNAAGSVIGNAANLSYGVNIVSGADNTTGVILPVAVANGCVEIMQITNGKQLAVYPQVNSAIAGLAANAAFNTGAANTAATAGTSQNVYFKFVATNATQWYVDK